MPTPRWPTGTPTCSEHPMQPVVTIGDCITDEIRSEFEEPRRFAGGAGLNFAAGIARSGLPSTLITRVGQDRDGYYLIRYARERGIRVINTPSADPTGVAVSTRIDGEPSYSFGPAMFRRRILFREAARNALSSAGAVVVNSFPFDNERQTDGLADALRSTSGIRVVDPNPRPRLTPDVAAYRWGVEAVLPDTWMVKISDEDAQVLYGVDWRQVAPRLFDLGVQTILFSHGPNGASVLDRSGLSVHVPVVILPEPIIDTMGAGDAMLASVVATLVGNGRPQSGAEWKACLTQAMTVAAATCRHAGAEPATRL